MLPPVGDANIRRPTINIDPGGAMALVTQCRADSSTRSCATTREREEEEEKEKEKLVDEEDKQRGRLIVVFDFNCLLSSHFFLSRERPRARARQPKRLQMNWMIAQGTRALAPEAPKSSGSRSVAGRPQKITRSNCVAGPRAREPAERHVTSPFSLPSFQDYETHN